MKIFTTCYLPVRRYLLPAVIAAGLAIGCGHNERVDNSGTLAKEIKSSKIKRVTTAELTAALHRTGQEIAETATHSLEKNTLAAQKECHSTETLKELDQVKRTTGAEIGLLFARDSSGTALFSKEKDLLQAYGYQADRGLDITENLQKINDSISIYYAPVASSSVIFTNCEEARQSPFAIWRIVLSHKEIIKNLDF